MKVSFSNNKTQNLLFLVFSLLSSFLILMICTRSSFLYPMNDWTDAQCFFTVGKAMGNGQVLYRDIFEQKGFLLYCIHMLAYFVSHTTFAGVFVAEILAGTIFMFFNMKTITLYVNQVYAFLFAPLCSAMIYSSSAFDCGDSAEEFCIPIFAFMFYLSARTFQSDKFFSPKELVMIGIVSGCILWIKYTMLGFFIGWVIIPIIWLIKEKKYKSVWQTLLFITLGVFIISLPVIVYFLVHHALNDLWTVYFYNNIFVYSNTQGIQENQSFLQCIYTNLYIAMLDNKSFSIAIFAGFAGFLLIKGWKQKMTLYISFTFLVCTIFGTPRYFGYYCIALSAFSVFGYVVAAVLATKLLHKIRCTDTKCSEKVTAIICQSCTAVISVAIATVWAFHFSGNVYFMQFRQSDLPQYKFKEIICKEKNPTLLQYGGLDGGFYTVCDIVPNCKYFCGLNIPLDEISDGQQHYIDNGEGIFIVRRGAELQHDNYELVATENFDDGKTERIYYLYQLRKIKK